MKGSVSNRIKGFVLSTGRTGTVTLTSILNTDPNIQAMHEPKPSRIYHIMSDLYLRNKLHREVLAGIYFRSRKRMLCSNNYYIEINPFMWGMGSVFCYVMNNPSILHVVRDIRTYIVSIMNFKAHGWHRYLIDFIPFWETNVSKIILGIDNWDSLSSEEKISWRWVLMNQTIGETEKLTRNYMRIRFEDLFCENEAVQKDILDRISSFFHMKIDKKEIRTLLARKLNSSTKRSIYSFESINIQRQESILKIAAPLRKRYGYL